LLDVSASMCSLTYDFIVKSTGRTDLYGDGLAQFPLISDPAARLRSRAAILNCLSSHYSALWEDVFDAAFTEQSWSQPSNPRLPHDCFANLTREWSHDTALHTDYSRRMALVEIDVVVAQLMGLSLDELLLMYRVQFPVMQQHERGTWYDIKGRVVFTSRKGLVGVGLPRKVTPKSGKTTMVWPGGQNKQGLWGWDDLSAMSQRGELPDGTRIERQVMDDTLPGGPTIRTCAWVAPFALANREEDYRTAWAFFERSGKGS
jgi:hypothetical protein